MREDDIMIMMTFSKLIA